MRLVIADTGPINYLLLIGHIDVLPALFGLVILPAAVKDELNHPDTPGSVRDWMAHPPTWIEVHEASGPPAVGDLGAGETEAITLAIELGADLLLIDERRGTRAARSHGVEVSGTLAVLSRAGQRGMLDLPGAFEQLKKTTFRYRQEIMDQFLEGSSDGLAGS